MSLTHCTDVSAASWLASSAAPWQQLITFGPPVFDAYARLRFLPDPRYAGQAEADAGRDGRPCEHDLLRMALDVLARHTGTAADCYFCLWDGWGTGIDGDKAAGIPPAFARSVLRGPKVVLSHRQYYLFHGSLTEFGAWPTIDGSGPEDGLDPAFVWPSDHAWCLANDVDPHFAGIGAEHDAIEALLTQPGLDVVRADLRTEPPSYD